MCNLEYQFRPGLDLEMVQKALKALKEIDIFNVDSPERREIHNDGKIDAQ